MKYLSEVYGRGGIYAKCVAASIANSIPIYTLETKAPFTIDAEIEKHRMESTNSSSGRAIPISTTASLLYLDAYIPFDVRLNQKGMQGFEKASNEILENFLDDLNELREVLYYFVNRNKDIHKQHLNDYLKPFLFQTKVWTATEWDNFFALRLAADAKPEIQELAKCMKSAIDQAEPRVLSPGEWHLPYVDVIDQEYNLEIFKKESAARCARVSYNNHDNSSPSVEKDLALAELLLSSKHLTPFEHQATPMEYTHGVSITWDSKTNPHIYLPNGSTHIDINENYWSGNFRGWIQNRQLVSQWNG